MSQERTPTHHPPITITVVNGQHVCDPTGLPVGAGDTVVWNGPPNMTITYVGPSPFDSPGPFPTGQRITVRQDVPPKTTFKSQTRLDNGDPQDLIGDIVTN